MNAMPAVVLAATRTDALIAAALAYHTCERIVSELHASADQKLSNAYLSVEAAISALKAEGMSIGFVAALERIAHGLARDYERHRSALNVARDAVGLARLRLDGLHVRSGALRDLADELLDDNEADARRLTEVADMLDAEDYS